MNLIAIFLLQGVFVTISAQEVANISSTLQKKNIEIIFLHEPNQKEFLSSVDKIMEQLKRNDIEINYQNISSIPEDTQALQNLFCQLGVKGVSIVLDVTLSGSKTARDLMQSNLIPYFNFDYSIQSFVKALESYLIERQALNAVLIFEDSTATQEALYNFITKSTLRVILLDQLPPHAARRLKTLRPIPSFFGIIANSINMERLFRSADFAGLVSRLPEKWNLMFTDSNGESFEHFEYPEMSRLLLNNQTVCCNPECICTSQTTLKFEALSSFLKNVVAVLEKNDFLIRKFACDEESNVPEQRARKLLDDIAKMLEANNLIFVDEEFKIWQNLRFDVRTSVVNATTIETTASVDLSGVKTMENHHIKTVNRFLRIGVTESMPYTFFKRNPVTNDLLLDANNRPIYEGFCIDLIKEMARKMNFTYELVEPSSGKFGDRQNDGTFDGLVGDLIKGDTDLIVGALKMTAEREEQIDFVAPYFDQTGILIVMKKPLPDTSLFKFMTVLRLEVWFSILGALVTTAFVIWILDIFSPYSSRNWNYEEPCRKFTLRESVWFSLCSFTPQGGGEAPKALSSRIIVAAYWLFVVLMLATFTANLAAFLTVERMQSPVQSLDQLGRQSRINYTVVSGSDTHQYFKNMKHAEDTLYELWKETTLNASSENGFQFRIWDYPIKEQFGTILMAIESSNPLPNAAEGFRIVNEKETNDFAFIHDANEIKYEATRNCNFSIVGEIFAEQPYGIAVQQGSHLQDEVSRVILELQKDRFFEDLTAKYWDESFKQCKKSDDSEGITLQSLGGVFIATLAGLVVAMLVLACEVFYYQRKSKKVTDMSSDILKYSTPITKNTILLGATGEFIPVNKKPRLSFISVYHRE